MKRNHVALMVHILIFLLMIAFAITVKSCRYDMCRKEGLSHNYCLWR